MQIASGVERSNGRRSRVVRRARPGPTDPLSLNAAVRPFRSAAGRWTRRERRSVRGDDPVDQAVLGGLVGLEEPVALHVGVHALLALPGVLGVDLVDALARLEDLGRMDLDVGRLALEAGRRLVDEDARIGQREPLAL